MTLNKYLFGSAKLWKNADLDKYSYSGYGTAFDSRSKFLFRDRRFGKREMFGADTSPSLHIDNENKYILILGEGATQGLDNTTLTPETKYPINFTRSRKRFES